MKTILQYIAESEYTPEYLKLQILKWLQDDKDNANVKTLTKIYNTLKSDEVKEEVLAWVNNHGFSIGDRGKKIANDVVSYVTKHNCVDALLKIIHKQSEGNLNFAFLFKTDELMQRFNLNDFFFGKGNEKFKEFPNFKDFLEELLRAADRVQPAVGKAEILFQLFSFPPTQNQKDNTPPNDFPDFLSRDLGRVEIKAPGSHHARIPVNYKLTDDGKYINIITYIVKQMGGPDWDTKGFSKKAAKTWVEEFVKNKQKYINKFDIPNVKTDTSVVNRDKTIVIPQKLKDNIKDLLVNVNNEQDLLYLLGFIGVCYYVIGCNTTALMVSQDDILSEYLIVKTDAKSLELLAAKLFSNKRFFYIDGIEDNKNTCINLSNPK